jgi:hypothetical protein
VVFAIVLVPLCAGFGAALSACRRPTTTVTASRTLVTAIVIAFVIFVAALWQTFAVLTGAQRLF